MSTKVLSPEVTRTGGIILHSKFTFVAIRESFLVYLASVLVFILKTNRLCAGIKIILTGVVMFITFIVSSGEVQSVFKLLRMG